jgi:hypothetical protein
MYKFFYFHLKNFQLQKHVEEAFVYNFFYLKNKYLTHGEVIVYILCKKT